jgi:glycosyltransferase involved in cell wall biosynthesis
LKPGDNEVMKVCLLGLHNLSVLCSEYENHRVGGEPVQQTLLAKALARRGHEVSMVVADYGQIDGLVRDGVSVFKAFRLDAGIPILRFIHPRWTGLWAALKRADADLYYTSCAGMEVGLLALFCRYFGKKFVFRSASDSDCDKSRLLIKYARDRWLYAYGLRRANAILVQSAHQAHMLFENFGLRSEIAGMFVDKPLSVSNRDIDVLWVGNIRRLKRPDHVIELSAKLPGVNFHIVGDAMPGEESLYRTVRDAARSRNNLTFHGRLSYSDANKLYCRAKILLNTSDVEGFPNSYLQAWIRGVPVVTFIDPDGVIEREGLGYKTQSLDEMAERIEELLESRISWKASSYRCIRFMDQEFSDDKILSAYLQAFDHARHQGPDQPRAVRVTGVPNA